VRPPVFRSTGPAPCSPSWLAAVFLLPRRSRPPLVLCVALLVSGAGRRFGHGFLGSGDGCAFGFRHIVPFHIVGVGRSRSPRHGAGPGEIRSPRRSVGRGGGIPRGRAGCGFARVVARGADLFSALAASVSSPGARREATHLISEGT
jgi:hypothetical protein